MKLSKNAGAMIILGGLAVVCFGLFFGIATGGFGLLPESNELLSRIWMVHRPWEILLWLALTSIGASYILFAIVAIWGVAFYRVGRRLQAYLLFAAFFFSETVTVIFKQLWDLPRPDEMVLAASSPGFPSGHTVTVTAVLGLLAVFASKSKMDRADKRWVVIVSLFMIGTVGMSRVALAMHYPNDVLAGWLLGAGIFSALYLVFVLRSCFGVKDGKRLTREKITQLLLISLLIFVIGVATHWVQLAI